MVHEQQGLYLESKVLTAPPHRLQLLLVEGAIRFGGQAQQALQRGDRAAAAGPLLRALDVLGEMIAGVREQKSELNRRLADLYWFLFRRLFEARTNGDPAALAEALQLLEYERQTWQLVCEKLAGAGGPPAVAPPHLPNAHTLRPHATNNSLSLDA